MYVEKCRPVVNNRLTDSVHRRKPVKELKGSKRHVHEEKRDLKQGLRGKTSTEGMLVLFFVVVVVVVGGAPEGKLLASRRYRV